MTFLKLFLFSLIASATDLRGGITSGGGGAFVCLGFKTNEFVDLWDAENHPVISRQFAYNIVYDDNTDPMAQAHQAMRRLLFTDSSLYSESVKNLDFLQQPESTIDLVDVEIIPEDLNSPFRKPGCRLSGVGYYSGELEKLLVRRDIYNNLRDKTHQAAFWVHEAVYKALRDISSRFSSWPITDSRLARRLTACLFSENSCFDERSFEEKLARYDGGLRCVTFQEETVFYVQPRSLASEAKEFEILFEKISLPYGDGLWREFPNGMESKARISDREVRGGSVSLGAKVELSWLYSDVGPLISVRMGTEATGEQTSLTNAQIGFSTQSRFTSETVTCSRFD